MIYQNQKKKPREIRDRSHQYDVAECLNIKICLPLSFICNLGTSSVWQIGNTVNLIMNTWIEVIE